MKLRYSILIFFLASSISIIADNTYFVYLHDKCGSPYSLDMPWEFLSERSLLRRERQHIEIDSTDLPVSELYIDSIRSLGARVVHCSKWINGVTIEADTNIIKKIRTLDFIDSVQLTKLSDTVNVVKTTRHKLPANLQSYYGEARQQTEQINLNRLHDRGFRGQGMLIAVVDNGFLNSDHISAFNHARENIVDTCSFVEGVGGIYEACTHGTYVLSVMAAELPEKFIGGAIDAQYALYRTEDDRSESMLEVDNQVAAFERADSIGADIINSSLGYFHFDDTLSNFNYSDLNGRTARNTIASTMAARKGMIVCIAAGNEGNSAWHFIDTPADADSILCVGSVDSLRQHSSFSSYGPSADGRIKPDICTMGEYSCVVSSADFPSRGNGTSFASPLAAAMVACLWSSMKGLSNMQLIELIKQHSSNHDSPNISIGYGIPDAWECYMALHTGAPANFDSGYSPNDTQYFDMLGRQVIKPAQGIYIRIIKGKAEKVIL